MVTNTNKLPLVKVFWTGGYDSSFRMVQLSKFRVVIQPYYMVDSRYRHSIRNEMNAIEEITYDIRNKPETKCLIKPLIKVIVSEIPPDEEITDAYHRIKKAISLGSQYDWLTRFAKSNPSIELCLEKAESGRIFKYFNRSGKMIEIKEGEITYLIVNKAESDKDMVTVFGDFRYPLSLREVTKLDMVEEYKKLGFAETMQKTWFCHNPVNNEPCGVCNPCKSVVKEGLSFRLTPAGMKRYKTEVKYGDHLWFKFLKKIRWRMFGY